MKHKKSKIEIANKNIEEKNISVCYPELKSKDRKKYYKANQSIVEMVRIFIKEELKDGISIQGDYKITLIRRSLLSMIYEFFCFSEENNSGFSKVKSLTVNIRNAGIYNLKDLFQEESDYVNVLNKIILNNIKDNDIAIIEEFGNINKNRSYYLSDDSLVIYYNLYRSSNYASFYCTPEFAIPYDSIKSIICYNIYKKVGGK